MGDFRSTLNAPFFWSVFASPEPAPENGPGNLAGRISSRWTPSLNTGAVLNASLPNHSGDYSNLGDEITGSARVWQRCVQDLHQDDPLPYTKAPNAFGHSITADRPCPEVTAAVTGEFFAAEFLAAKRALLAICERLHDDASGPVAISLFPAMTPTTSRLC